MNELKRSHCEHHDYKTQASSVNDAHNGKATRTYDGKIISVRFTDNGETVVHVNLPTAEAGGFTHPLD